MPTTTRSAANAPPTPSKIQRSAPSVYSAPTSPGAPKTSKDGNPYHVDFVIPYDISPAKQQSRTEAEKEAVNGYGKLLDALKAAGGISVTCRSPPKGAKAKDELWVLVKIQDWRLRQLIDAETESDKAHLIPSTPAQAASPTTRLRLLFSLLTSELGITPGEGEWKRVKAIAALHDEQQDELWLNRWKDWRVGLFKGIEQDDELGDNQPPHVHLYFAFLHHYTLSLIPLSAISALFYFFAPGYSPLYGALLVLYGLLFTSTWRVKQRKLAIRWGTAGCEAVAVTALRPQFSATSDRIQAATDRKLSVTRDFKMATSVPAIVLCGLGLGAVLSGIFVLEAFVGQVWDGFGKDYISIVPTLMFVGIVPQIVGAYHTLAEMLVKWENHPTVVGAEKSLTAKVFAMNAIVAYLGLFLSAYIYVPFGAPIMAYVQTRVDSYTAPTTPVVHSAEKAGLGPKTAIRAQKGIKADRLRGQMFAYTVTNQVINAATELVLPFVMRFISDWRAGKTTFKDAFTGHTATTSTNGGTEARFLAKIDDELALPDYAIFTDYAEMVTQFGYVTLWSIVWPLAPVFALINNYIELRSDAIKICKHVRRPVGTRVETIGAWLQTLSIITWLGSITNATLIYMFRSHAHFEPTLRSIAPIVFWALAGSHVYVVARWLVDAIVERALWRGSDEDVRAEGLRGALIPQRSKTGSADAEKQRDDELEGSGFWDGAVAGIDCIRRNLKTE